MVANSISGFSIPTKLHGAVTKVGGILTTAERYKLKTVLDDWFTANEKYFNVYFRSKLILTALENKENIDISHITDLHEQGYINYCIEQQYNIEIPVYDYRYWFQSTEQIQQAINKINEKNLISN